MTPPVFTVVTHAPELDVPILTNAAPVTYAQPPKSPARKKPPAPPPYNGSAVWATLHRRALTWDAGDDSAWLVANVNGAIPCGTCRTHWAQVLQKNPPRWGDYFAWSVEAHNAVNAQLGKPQIALEEARSRWAPGAVDKGAK